MNYFWIYKSILLDTVKVDFSLECWWYNTEGQGKTVFDDVEDNILN